MTSSSTFKPAMETCKIEPLRSDHLQEPGKISEQVFKCILKFELYVAVLTDYNPKVFYELAVAQTACRPVILLIKKQWELACVLVYSLQSFVLCY